MGLGGPLGGQRSPMREEQPQVASDRGGGCVLQRTSVPTCRSGNPWTRCRRAAQSASAEVEEGTSGTGGGGGGA